MSCPIPANTTQPDLYSVKCAATIDMKRFVEVGMLRLARSRYRKSSEVEETCAHAGT